MKWQTKAFVLRQLSRIPLGKRLYLTAQKILGTTRVQPRRDLQRACELLQLINETGQTVRDSLCYEIGTGWHPFTPLAFYLAGARKVLTVDVNPWLSFSSIQQTIRAAEPHLAWFSEQIGQDEKLVRQRYQKIDLQAKTPTDLLASFHCEYTFPGDARQTGLESGSLDFVISSNVLEHIPPAILRDIATESLRTLKPGGLFVHRFNPGDHYANDDDSVTTINFLQYSPQEWQKYGDGLAYHNRLRCSQYSQLLGTVGYLALIEKTRVEERALETLAAGNFPLHEEFAGYQMTDLAADYMWYVGMKPNALLDPGLAERPLPVTSSFVACH